MTIFEKKVPELFARGLVRFIGNGGVENVCPSHRYRKLDDKNDSIRRGRIGPPGHRMQWPASIVAVSTGRNDRWLWDRVLDGF